MRLNLADPDKSDIPFELVGYPDGQQDIKLDAGYVFGNYVTIWSRMNGLDYVELIACAVSALRNLGVERIDLFAPYLLGGRSDRQFVTGGSHYLRDVIAPVINSLGFGKVIILDPHSDVTEAVIKNAYVLSNRDFISWCLLQLSSDLTWVAPDAGATKKIFPLAKALNAKEVIIAEKVRDVPTGQITDTRCQGDVEGKECLIVDDICDGGRTFIELAKLLKLKGATKVYLAVTHGIFSQGTAPLVVHIDKIFSTNSVKESGAFVTTYNVF